MAVVEKIPITAGRMSPCFSVLVRREKEALVRSHLMMALSYVVDDLVRLKEMRGKLVLSVELSEQGITYQWHVQAFREVDE